MVLAFLLETGGGRLFGTTLIFLCGRWQPLGWSSMRRTSRVAAFSFFAQMFYFSLNFRNVPQVTRA